MKYIVVLDEGKAGHTNQAVAVAEALAQVCGGEVRIIRALLRGWAKYPLRMCLNHRICRKYLERSRAWKVAYRIDEMTKCPDIVVSSGKNTSMLNVWMASVCSAKSVYVGNPKKLDHRLFDAVVTVLDLGFDNQILLDVAPTLPYRGDLDAFCKENGLDRSKRYCALLIGGDGSGYRYTDQEYDALIAYVNRTAKDINWLVTTSRRTPLDVEKRMRAQMNAAMFVAYNQEPKKVIGAFLALSEMVYVTEESASMIGEAISSQTKVVALKPNIAKIESNYQKILDKYIKAQALLSIDIANLTQFDISRIDIKPYNYSSFDELREKLKKVLL
jgi:mitochondrial fission protein ELM1